MKISNWIKLIGVYRLSGYYYKSPEELIELLGVKTPRKALSPRVLKIFAGAGLLSLSVPLSIFGPVFAEKTGSPFHRIISCSHAVLSRIFPHYRHCLIVFIVNFT